MKTETFTSKKGIPVIVEGELNFDLWAKKVKQVEEDAEAGRYEEMESAV